MPVHHHWQFIIPSSSIVRRCRSYAIVKVSLDKRRNKNCEGCSPVTRQLLCASRAWCSLQLDILQVQVTLPSATTQNCRGSIWKLPRDRVLLWWSLEVTSCDVLCLRVSCWLSMPHVFLTNDVTLTSQVLMWRKCKPHNYDVTIGFRTKSMYDDVSYLSGSSCLYFESCDFIYQWRKTLSKAHVSITRAVRYFIRFIDVMLTVFRAEGFVLWWWRRALPHEFCMVAISSDPIFTFVGSPDAGDRAGPPLPEFLF
jgi:hypothetical protein